MATLAIVGGPRAVPEDHAHELAWTRMIEEEAETVAEMVRQGNLSTPGGNEIIKAFEREISDYWGVRYALCTPNGTAAIHSGLFACGVGAGDEVIVQSYTHPFSVLPILAVGAVPVFSDIHPDTLSMDLEDMERKITSRTRAILPVAGGRRITDIRAIVEIARRHDLKVVEDSCTCFGEKVEGKHYGTFGQAGNLSLQIRKMLGSGEGGVVFTDDSEVYERATLLGHYERVPDLSGERFREFGAMALGFKYRMSPVTAAIARIKLGHLERRLARWRRNLGRIYEAVCEVRGLSRPNLPDWYDAPVRPGYVGYDEQDMDGVPIEVFVDAVRSEGADVTGPGPVGHAMHLKSVFTDGGSLLGNVPSLALATDTARSTYGPGALPVTEAIQARGWEHRDRITLPCLAHVSDETVNHYIDAFLKVPEHLDALH